MAPKNPIWDYFDKSETGNSKAVRKICKKTFSLGSHMPKKQTTSGLKLHLSITHNTEYDLVLKRKQNTRNKKKRNKKEKKHQPSVKCSISQ